MIILGIDPSLRGTGWGILPAQKGVAKVAHGVIRISPKATLSECLLKVHSELTEVIRIHRPTVVATEGLIYAQNLKTSIIMGQVRGVALLTAAAAGLAIYEYAPRRVKQSVVGKGAARKSQVGFMVRALLGLDHTPDADAADALGVALTHLNAHPLNREAAKI